MTDIRTKNNNITAIILMSGRDFGRCPLASRLPTALWPVGQCKAIEKLLVHLADNGIKKVVICSSGLDKESYTDSIHRDDRLEMEFLYEPLPVGTAGCIRDAAAEQRDGLLLVFSAGLINPPPIDVLINAHYEGKSDLTVMFNPSDGDSTKPGVTSGIYICSPRVIEHIPEGGYFDIKEGLIPAMLRVGKTVNAATLPEDAGNFRNWHQYLRAVTDNLKQTTQPKTQNVYISPSAKIIGPVVVMEGARISDGATVIGPAIISGNVTIGPGSIVVNSVLWDGVQTGPNCRIQQSVIDYNVVLPAQTIVRDNKIQLKKKTIIKRIVDIKSFLSLFLFSLVFIAFFWSYHPNIEQLWQIWLRNDEYSSGLLVPFIAVYMLWLKRQELACCTVKSAFSGVIFLLAAVLLRLFGQLFVFSSAENLSVVFCIAALVLLLFGRQLFRKTATVLLFLFLMLPWPNRIQTAVSLPLQQWSTSSAVFCLELAGFTVVREGNLIRIGSATVAVAEACNGLRMITAFFVISALVALIVKRRPWEKFIVLISSLPIALLCNTVRLTITAIFFTILKGDYWEKGFHDFGGYAMMPLALAAVLLELWLMKKLTTPPYKTKAIIVTRGQGYEPAQTQGS
jgi:exosortase